MGQRFCGQPHCVAGVAALLQRERGGSRLHQQPSLLAGQHFKRRAAGREAGGGSRNRNQLAGLDLAGVDQIELETHGRLPRRNYNRRRQQN